jgi:hypothetical protein
MTFQIHFRRAATFIFTTMLLLEVCCQIAYYVSVTFPLTRTEALLGPFLSKRGVLRVLGSTRRSGIYPS